MSASVLGVRTRLTTQHTNKHGPRRLKAQRQGGEALLSTGEAALDQQKTRRTISLTVSKP